MLDFTKLNIEYSAFWQKHSLSNAVSVLKEVDFYISGGKYDTFLLPYGDILKPENLIVYYRLTGSNLTFDEIAKKVTYKEMIENFIYYLNKLIKRITDYQRKIKAISKLNLFSSIVGSLAS